MARVVDSVASEYGDAIHWERVVTKEIDGALRYGELSKCLGRPAPVPSIFINGELAFDQTPSGEALKTYLERYL
jgi:hypothetical protein